MNTDQKIRQICRRFGYDYNYVVDLIREEYLLINGDENYFNYNVDSAIQDIKGDNSLNDHLIRQAITTVIEPLTRVCNKSEKDLSSMILMWSSMINGEPTIKPINNYQSSVPREPQVDKKIILLKRLMGYLGQQIVGASRKYRMDYLQEVSRMGYRFLRLAPFDENNDVIFRMIVNYMLTFRIDTKSIAFSKSSMEQIKNAYTDVSRDLDQLFDGTYLMILKCEENLYSAQKIETEALTPFTNTINDLTMKKKPGIDNQASAYL